MFIFVGFILFIFIEALWEYRKIFWAIREKHLDSVREGRLTTKRLAVRHIQLPMLRN